MSRVKSYRYWFVNKEPDECGMKSVRLPLIYTSRRLIQRAGSSVQINYGEHHQHINGDITALMALNLLQKGKERREKCFYSILISHFKYLSGSKSSVVGTRIL